MSRRKVVRYSGSPPLHREGDDGGVVTIVTTPKTPVRVFYS